ncbi:MAG: GspE/PulE family protein [Candidatus Dojkabacteria bacterium]|nr:MAG: GspE/PulE family protein [Candidatus Dojkabacteria bacterium]
MTQSSKTEEAALLERNLVTVEDVAKAKSEMFNIPYVDLRAINIQDSVFSAFDIEKLKRYNAVPFEQSGHVIKVAMSDPFDVQATQALTQVLMTKGGGRILVHIATQDSVDFVLDSHIGGLISTEVSEALEDFEGGEVTELKDEDAGALESGDLKNAPVARIVNSILQYAIKSEASDVHIEPLESSLRVRFRIHGVMIEKLTLPRNMKDSVVARIKIMSNMKIDEKRVPQDQRLQVKSNGKRFDVRVSTMPSIHGEKVVMRLLDGSQGVPALETSGLRGGAYQQILDGLKLTNGIILITGPTGSGKTRTLAGALDKLNTTEVNIITLEDPVEIRIPGITQIQVNKQVGLTFAVGLRSILRQDPDIVMVGEIRDQETAELAVEASLTGHLVLATLHTNSAAAAIPRLIDMGIQDYLLASALRIAAAQRLPRRICNDCMEAYPASEADVANIKEVFGSIKGFDVYEYLKKLAASAGQPGQPEHLAKLKAPDVDANGAPQFYLYRGKGCSKCGGSGYKGRIAIFEVMTVDGEISEIIKNDPSDAAIQKAAVEKGMITMIQDGYLKALEGITTPEEVLRVSRE